MGLTYLIYYTNEPFPIRLDTIELTKVQIICHEFAIWQLCLDGICVSTVFGSQCVSNTSVEDTGGRECNNEVSSTVGSACGAHIMP